MKVAKNGFTSCVIGGVILFGIIEACVYLPVDLWTVWVLTLPAAVGSKIGIPAAVALGAMAICIAFKLDSKEGRLRKAGKKRKGFQAQAGRMSVATGWFGLLGVIALTMAFASVLAIAGEKTAPSQVKIVNAALSTAEIFWNNGLAGDDGDNSLNLTGGGDNWQISKDYQSATRKGWMMCQAGQEWRTELKPGAEILNMDGKPETCAIIGMHRVILKVTPGLAK